MTFKDYIKSCVPSAKKIAVYSSCLLATVQLGLSAQVKKEGTPKAPAHPQVSRSQPTNAVPSRYRIPTKAALYSAVLPGLGQAYNRKYWKIPIVYTLIGASVYFIKDGNDKYRRIRNAFITRINGGHDEFEDILSLEQMAKGADDYERDKNLAIVFTGVFYALNILDALVDAHLSEFDIDKDLMRLSPILVQTPNRHVQKLGIGLCLTF